jgi:hypothetical protein
MNNKFANSIYFPMYFNTIVLHKLATLKLIKLGDPKYFELWIDVCQAVVLIVNKNE